MQNPNDDIQPSKYQNRNLRHHLIICFTWGAIAGAGVFMLLMVQALLNSRGFTLDFFGAAWGELQLRNWKSYGLISLGVAAYCTSAVGLALVANRILKQKFAKAVFVFMTPLLLIALIGILLVLLGRSDWKAVGSAAFIYGIASPLHLILCMIAATHFEVVNHEGRSPN